MPAGCDDDPVFARLVGGEDGGSFRIAPAGAAQLTCRRYRPGFALLETRWGLGSAELTLTEGMVANVARRLLPTTLVVRRLEARGGPVGVRVHFDPRQGEERRRPRLRRQGGSVVCSWGSLAVALSGSGDLVIEPGRDVEVVVGEGRPRILALATACREPLVHVPPELAWEELLATDVVAGSVGGDRRRRP